MRCGSPAGRLLVWGAVLTAALLVPAPQASASGTELRSGQVIQLSSTSGVGFTTPADGRLRGEDYQAQVTGVAWPTGNVGVGCAEASERLVVFTLQINQPDTAIGDSAKSPAAVVSAGGTSSALDLSSVLFDERYGGSGGAGTSMGSFAACVPAPGHDAVLAMTEAGSSASLSLWTLERIAPDPTVLYRASDASAVAADPAPSGTISFANPADGVSASSTFLLDSASLGYFDANGVALDNPGQAELSVVAESDHVSGSGGQSYFSDLTTLAADRLTFTPTGGTPVGGSASVPAPVASGRGINDDGLLDATYYFTVPATTTTGTFAVTPGPVTGTESDQFVGAVPLTVTRSVPIALEFPPGSAEPVQPPPPWTRTVTAAKSSSQDHSAPASGTAGSSGSGGAVIAAVVALGVVVLVVLAVVLGRRRRGRQQTTEMPADDRVPKTTAPRPKTVPMPLWPAHGTVRPEPTLLLCPMGPRRRRHHPNPSTTDLGSRSLRHTPARSATPTIWSSGSSVPSTSPAGSGPRLAGWPRRSPATSRSTPVVPSRPSSSSPRCGRSSSRPR